MYSILNSCSTTDFGRVFAEKHRIQGLISSKATLDNLREKQLARNQIRNKIKLTPIISMVFSGSGTYVGNQYSKWCNTFKDLVLNGLSSSTKKLRILRQN